MQTNNKRRNTRVPFQTTITIQFADKRYEKCKTRNLSLKGVFVVGVANRKVGEKCDIILYLSGGTSSNHALTMKGQVVRTDEGGVGLYLFEIDLDSFYHLKNILYYNSENPDTLKDEFVDEINYF